MITNTEIKKFKQVFATKDDLQQFATKDDLIPLATKKDLERYATKDDLNKELARYITKDEFRSGIDQIIQMMSDMFNEVYMRFDRIHDDIQSHQRQLDNHETRLLKIETSKSN